MPVGQAKGVKLIWCLGPDEQLGASPWAISGAKSYVIWPMGLEIWEGTSGISINCHSFKSCGNHCLSHHRPDDMVLCSGSSLRDCPQVRNQVKQAATAPRATAINTNTACPTTEFPALCLQLHGPDLLPPLVQADISNQRQLIYANYLTGHNHMAQAPDSRKS